MLYWFMGGFNPLDAMLGMDVVGHNVTPEMAVKFPL
jgi:hypothetical protein